MGCSKEMLQNGKRGGLVIMRLTEKDDLGHWFLKGLESVSYTHLDVYKRQK